MVPRRRSRERSLGSTASSCRSASALLVLVLAAGFFHPKVEAAPKHLRVAGTQFLKPDGTVFAWRGITSFRLVEFVARGRESDADAYLAWAASKKLTIVRVLGMADGLFTLSPSDGLKALPRLLEMAQKRGLHVEVVALADTAAIRVDIPGHVKAVAEICGRFPNALLEIANEPVHATQARALHDPAFLKSLVRFVPAGVPVSLGSVENGDGFGGGTYVTWHAPRTAEWPRRMGEEGMALVRRFKKPVISDEPMGAADQAVRGRRDNDPNHFRQAAEAARRAGIGATFHYEGGLQSKLPSKIEMASLEAWLAGLNAGRSTGASAPRSP